VEVALLMNVRGGTPDAAISTAYCFNIYFLAVRRHWYNSHLDKDTAT
jgi:hypothetical protein